MENSSPKLNTILLFALVVLAAACLVVLLTQRTGRGMADQDRFSDMNYSGQNQNMQNGMTIGSQMQTPPAGQNQIAPNTQTVVSKQKFSSKGMSVSVPVGQGYLSDTLVPRVMGNAVDMLNIGKDRVLSVSLTKFHVQAGFDESASFVTGGRDWVLVNANYSVSGLSAQYYEGKTGVRDGEIMILVPSKLVTVYGSKFPGTSKSLLAEILATVVLD